MTEAVTINPSELIYDFDPTSAAVLDDADAAVIFDLNAARQAVGTLAPPLEIPVSLSDRVRNMYNRARLALPVIGLAGAAALSSCQIKGTNENVIPPAINNNVVQIGDSISVEEAINGINPGHISLAQGYAEHGMRLIGFEANIGHQLVGGAAPDGMKEISDQAANIKNAGTVVIEMDTNPMSTLPLPHLSPQQVQAQANQAVALVRSINHRAHVIWENLATSRPNLVAEMSGRNQGIDAGAKNPINGYQIYSWVNTAEGPNADPEHLVAGPDPALIRGDLQGGVHMGSPAATDARIEAETKFVSDMALNASVSFQTADALR